MYLAMTVLHLGVCLFLILTVLLQRGKGADLAGAFGGGSQTAFGARGASSLLSRLTTISAVVFMVTSFTLAMMANRGIRSVVTDEPTEQSAPVVPLPAPLDQPGPDPALDESTPPEESDQ